jgi:hypothetical protein
MKKKKVMLKIYSRKFEIGEERTGRRKSKVGMCGCRFTNCIELETYDINLEI